MSTAPAAVPGDRRGRLRGSVPVLLPWVLIAAVVLLANALILSGVFAADPELLRSGLASVGRRGLVVGDPTLDHNDGWVSLSLGRAAARALVHGDLPLWTPHMGVGSPLLGDGQSAAFFPLTLLTLLPRGLIVEHVVLEVLSGWFTYALGRQLRWGRALAVTIGLAFALNGTFAWLANAPVNPICFLPLTLLGVERVRDRLRGGAAIVTAGVALSLLAGFPETAAIDLILAGWWTLLRLPGASAKAGMLLRVAAGAAVGGLLSAPAVLPFERALSIGFTGPHDNSLTAFQGLPGGSVMTLGLPYLFGEPSQYVRTYPYLGGVWSMVGGYITVTVLLLAIVGLGARRASPWVRGGLALWITVCLLRTFGYQPVCHLLAHVPELNRSLFFRYAQPSWELSAMVLAGFGVDELRRARGTARMWLLRVLVGVGVGSILVILWQARPTLRGTYGGDWSRLALAQVALAGLAVVVLGAATVGRRFRLREPTVLGLIAVDVIAAFLLPQLTGHRDVTVDDRALAALRQQSVGVRTYAQEGGLSFNFGAFYGLRLLDVDDNPVPKAWIRLRSELTELPDNQVYPTPSTGLALREREQAYEDAGVGVFATRSPKLIPPDATVVFRDQTMIIARLPHPRPLISPLDGSADCTATGQEYATFHVTCARATTLRISQLALPGWTADVNGRSVKVGSTLDGIWQLLDVPAGTSTVVMRYWAPGLTAGFALAGVGAVGGLVLWNLPALGRGAGSARDHLRGRSHRRRGPADHPA